MSEKCFFGVDSAAGAQGLAPSVHAFAGALPSWWGRYIGTYALDAAEASWLHGRGARILLVWNGAGAGDVASNYAHGVEHGQRAAAAAKALGAPAGVFVPIDVETPWSPTSAFLAGYLDAVHAGGYVGGAYLNVLEQQHVAPWIAARQQSKAPGYVYSSEPEPYSLRDTVQSGWYDFSQTPLGTAHAGDVAIWQYWENSLNGTIDLDVASQTGYDLLWRPAPPPVARRTTVIAACGLKPHAAHGGPNLAEIPARGQIIDSGVRSGDWGAVQWRDLEGWVEASNIR